MAIFGTGNTLYTDPQVEYNVSPTEEGSAEILYEGAKEFYKILAGAYISDIMIESAVLEGTGDAEVLTEATAKEIIDKIIGWFKSMLAKIKAWFKKVFENLKVFFMSGEKFAKTYEKQLKEKAKLLKSDDLTYEGYDYALIGEQITDRIIDTVDKYQKAVDVAVGKLEKDSDVSELKEDALKVVDAENIAELKDNLQKAVNGSETTVFVKNVGGKVGKMIELCKNKDKVIKAIKKLEDKTEKDINKIIGDLEKDKKADAGVVSKKSDLYRTVVSVQQGLNATGISLVKAQYRTYTSVLKKLFSFKPAKEAYTTSDDGSSLLEAAMKLV